MAEHDIGFQAPRLPEAGEAHLHREQGGLSVRGLLQRLSWVMLFAQALIDVGAVHIENYFEQGLFENVGECYRTTCHCLGEHRLGVEQFPGHAGVLAPLAGEQPCRLR